MVKKAEALRSIDELNLSNTRKSYLRKKFGDDMGSLVKAGRKYALSIDKSPTHVIKGSKYVMELAAALDEAGYIRHDFNPKTWCLWRLYSTILGMPWVFGKNDILESDIINLGHEDFVLSEYYENMPIPAVSDNDYNKLFEVLNSLPDVYRDVLVGLFGLDDGNLKTFEIVGNKLGMTRERVRLTESKVLRKLRVKDRRCKLPAIFGYIPPNEPKPFSPLSYIEIDGKKVVNPDSDILGLGLSKRTEVCVMRAGLYSISDILNFPKDKWKRVRNLGPKGLSEITEKVHALGFTSFNPF